MRRKSWPTASSKRRRYVIPTLVFVAAFGSGASADEGCGAIGWSVQREQGWFAAKGLQRRPSGARFNMIDRAVELALKPLKEVPLFLPPAMPASAKSYAGAITFFGVPKPGIYEVTLSQPAHVDVFENGVRIKPLATSNAPKCDNARVSARYDLGTGDLVLVQVTDAAGPDIKVAFAEAE
jgi:hypothetical protein